MRTAALLSKTRVAASADADGDTDGDSEDAYVLVVKASELPLVKRMHRPDEV
jgi:hypothetical protein